MSDKKEHPVPVAAKDDPEDVSWALSTAEAVWTRGDHADAVKWIRRAVESASEAGNDDRALFLAKAAADISSQLGRPQTSPPPLPSVAPVASVASVVPNPPASSPRALSSPVSTPAPNRVTPATPRVSSPPLRGSVTPAPPRVSYTPGPPAAASRPAPRLGHTPPLAPRPPPGERAGSNSPPRAATSVPMGGTKPTAGGARGAHAAGPPTDADAPPSARTPDHASRNERRHRELDNEKTDPHEFTPRENLREHVDARTPVRREHAEGIAASSAPASGSPPWPTPELGADDGDSPHEENTRVGAGPYVVVPEEGAPAKAPALRHSQAIHVVVWRAADGVHVAPQGTVVNAITIEAILIATDPAADLAAWLTKT